MQGNARWAVGLKNNGPVYRTGPLYHSGTNGKLDDMDVDLVMEDSLPIKRQRCHKRLDGELSIDNVTEASESITKYRVEVYNRIVDTIVNSVEQRFDRSAASTLYADLSLLHPRNFDQVPSGSMEELHKYLLRFDDGVTAEQLRTELRSLGAQWSTLKKSIEDAYTTVSCSRQKDDQDSHSESEAEQDGNRKTISSSTCKSCTACPLCCYKVLLKLNLFTDAYKSIGLAYKLLLTLPVSQVACERSFSTLKRIKSRLRSTMTQEHLEAFMLMSVEKGILTKLDNNDIIDGVAVRSNELTQTLTSLAFSNLTFIALVAVFMLLKRNIISVDY